MGYQSEAQLEQLLIADMIKRGFDRVSIPDKKSLVTHFRKTLYLYNQDKLSNTPFTDKEFERVMLHIEGKSVFESAKRLRDKFLLFREDGSEVYIDFLNKDWNKNIYHVANQIKSEGKYSNRYDVTILINGLPLVQIEIKRRGGDIKEAFSQILRYSNHSYDGLFRYIQMFVISNGIDTKYFANSDIRPAYSMTFFWTDENNQRITTLSDFTDTFLARAHLTKMMSKYTVLNQSAKSLMILRPYQVYAIEAMVRRALETNNNGYVWHTTGSGKTLTSFKVSQLLSGEPNIKKVFFVVDRVDLDSQTTAEFNKFEEDSVDNTDSTTKLVSLIDDKSKKLIVTTIQKLNKALSNPRHESVLSVYKDEKVIFIFDECHRSQFGEMHKAIKKYFSKAQYFGFTGTPRFKDNQSQDGRTTADIFGKCLHTYLIKEAISDNNVLGFSVQYIKTFHSQYEKNDIELSSSEMERIYGTSERISVVANHIIQHHNHMTSFKKYTAIFATQSIASLIKYYDEFKSINHNLRIAAVYSFGANEDMEGKLEHSRDTLERIIKDYNKEFGTNYSTDTFANYNTDISKRVKSSQIDILIVVDMYLTGFDSQWLNTLYVDKNLQKHELLQAFSRTNRVESHSKPYGNIVCYRNLKQQTDEAIKLFSQTDSVDDVLMKEYEFYLDLFKHQLARLYEIAPTYKDVDAIISEDEKKNFVITFRDLSKQLLVLRSFVEFEFEEDELGISEQTYEDFKSKYFLIYDSVREVQGHTVSVLGDIDFGIELMETNRINVAYIMNLIKSINLSSKESKKKDIEYILSELERSDNHQLRKKEEFIRLFLKEIEEEFNPTKDLSEEYTQCENAHRLKEIIEFCDKHQVEVEFIKQEIAEYEYSQKINKDRLRDGLGQGMKLIEKSKLVEDIKEFIQTHVERYQS